MLRSGSVFTERSDEDGHRIYTAGRLTLGDGDTPHPQIAEGVGFDLWWPELAPEGSVYWEWYRGRIGWGEFSAAYLDRLRNKPESVERFEQLGEMAAKDVVTVLCLEDCAQHCHRGLLVVEFQQKFPGIAISAG